MLYDLALAAKMIANKVRSAGLADILGATARENVRGATSQRIVRRALPVELRDMVLPWFVRRFLADEIVEARRFGAITNKSSDRTNSTVRCSSAARANGHSSTGT